MYFEAESRGPTVHVTFSGIARTHVCCQVWCSACFPDHTRVLTHSIKIQLCTEIMQMPHTKEFSELILFQIIVLKSDIKSNTKTSIIIYAQTVEGKLDYNLGYTYVWMKCACFSNHCMYRILPNCSTSSFWDLENVLLLCFARNGIFKISFLFKH